MPIFKVSFYAVLIGAFFSVSLAQAASPALTAKASAQVPSSDSAKLDEILKNQKEILKKLEELKQELYIVKIRATR